jgi:hypothetical protein
MVEVVWTPPSAWATLPLEYTRSKILPTTWKSAAAQPARRRIPGGFLRNP